MGFQLLAVNKRLEHVKEDQHGRLALHSIRRFSGLEHPWKQLRPHVVWELLACDFVNDTGQRITHSRRGFMSYNFQELGFDTRSDLDGLL